MDVCHPHPPHMVPSPPTSHGIHPTPSHGIHPTPSHGTHPTRLTVPASAARSLPHSMQCTVKPMPDGSPSWRAASEHLAWYGHTTYRHTTDGHTVYGLTTYRHTTYRHTVYRHTIYAHTTHIHLPLLVSTIDNPQTCECINHSCRVCLQSCMWQC